MRSLFLFLFKYRTFFVFVFLQILCSWLIISNNQYQSAAFFTSSNRMAASIMTTTDNVSDYFNLSTQNKKLADENARLKMLLNQKQQISGYFLKKRVTDTAVLKQFNYLPAKVVKNSVNWSNNYITINKGSIDGIKKGMGVVSHNGIVGIVKSTSRHFSTITSLLHNNIFISSVIARTGDLCSTTWNGRDPYEASLRFVPRHIQLQFGDTIVTSGYNSIFDAGTLIGTVKETGIEENATFYDVKIDLATDFNSLSYVYVIENYLKAEKDSLEQNLVP
ncbi:rod shape-determining protein MreC [Fulvivirgaceae bacterium BMA12]|uniref:Cell shape-determining protein MreC n=1 Tax=Agaribacillus aureus TaxID=3051825 RepID=A0ABT8L880_9BACT|nr:rod shape-determining protein MreC [Fulvivirgaceae bacterium BMA12]